jgi:hypothetical protein
VPAPWAEANVVGANKSEAAMMAEKPNRDCMGSSIVDDDGQPPVLFDVPDRTSW